MSGGLLIEAGASELVSPESAPDWTGGGLDNPTIVATLRAGPPVMERLIPEADSTVRELVSVEVHFSQPVQGVEAGDLLINDVGATNVIQAEPGQFVFSFPQPASGMVRVSWRVDHGISDQGIPPLSFAGGAWSYLLDSDSPSSEVWISEFMADNKRTLNDENGDSSDWIEIFNSGITPASLAGWFLTDETNNLAKWCFPDITLPAKGYLVVFASEKNRTDIAGRLHTNFKLSTEGDYLALLTPATNVASEFAPAYPGQLTDTSYGRVEGEPQRTGYFTKPTPGGQNASSGPDFAPEVEFSRPGGTFTNAFKLVLSTASTNALIRYTVDGNLPTNSSPVYTVPLNITNSSQVRARAYQDGLLPGPPRSQTFLLLNSNVWKFSSDLPVLVLHALGKGAPAASRATFAHLSVYEPVNGRTALTNPPVLNARSSIQIRGSSTEGMAKSSYKLEFWDEFNLDQDLSFLGLPPDSDWVLYAPNSFDPVLIHNPFVHQLSRDMGLYSPRTRFVELYFNKSTGAIATNHYMGIYVVEEKIKIGPHRVAIDKLEPEHLKPPEVSGGYLLKVDRLDPGDTGLAAGGAQMAYVDPKEREIKVTQRRPQLNYIRDHFSALYKALISTNWRDPTLGYSAYIDRDNWIDFHVLEVLSGNVDALVLSTYLYKPRQGKIRFGPHWDFDRALGSTDGRDANPRIWSTGPFFTMPWWNRLFADKDFWQKWVDRWQDLRRTHFALTNTHALIDRLANEVRKAQPREYQKWRVPLRGGSYQSEINLMKTWLSNRIDFIDKQLTQPPRLSAPSGPVPAGFILILSGPTSATIYYTVDGSDPRASQGGISPMAILYSGPIRIDANARVVARARDLNKRQTGGPPTASSTPWSSPVAATLVVATPPVVVTEIMFHPAPAPPGSTNLASDFAFIELKNRGTEPLNLVGFHLTGGVDFTFTPASGVTNLPPGGRVLLVGNRAAFQSRYPGAMNVAGQFAGSLSNGSNRLILTGPLGEPIFDFVCQDDWAKLADGFGFSLVLVNESIAFDLLGHPASWRLSARWAGSPGDVDPPPVPWPRVFINEIVSNPKSPDEDAIELYNDQPAPTDVSGWWLTDDFRTPKKSRLPAGTLIDGYGFVVFRESLFHAGDTNGFGLSALGEAAFLFSADTAGELTGWFHGLEFGAQESGASLGRWLTSDGREHWVPYSWPSLGQANPTPATWPVAITEILYEPEPVEGADNTRDEFIELADLTFNALPGPLFDPSFPAHTWRLRGGVEFDFPAGFRFPESRRVVVVGFDPQRDSNALSAFRVRYRLDTAALILGPWRGSLSNTGGTVRLLKPLTPAAPPSPNAGLVPYALVEAMDYLPDAPWPDDAAKTGRSIAHRFPYFFGNEPALWSSQVATPGDADNDGDGLPDRWEISNGLNPLDAAGANGPQGDLDGDGFANAQEYFAGTSARDPDSIPRLSALCDAAGNITLTLQTGPSRTCTVLFRNSLHDGEWRVLNTLIAPVEGGVIRWSDWATNTARFYRLQWP